MFIVYVSCDKVYCILEIIFLVERLWISILATAPVAMISRKPARASYLTLKVPLTLCGPFTVAIIPRDSRDGIDHKHEFKPEVSLSGSRNFMRYESDGAATSTKAPVAHARVRKHCREGENNFC